MPIDTPLFQCHNDSPAITHFRSDARAKPELSIRAEDCVHHIHIEQPQLVIDAVREVVKTGEER